MNFVALIFFRNESNLYTRIEIQFSWTKLSIPCDSNTVLLVGEIVKSKEAVEMLSNLMFWMNLITWSFTQRKIPAKCTFYSHVWEFLQSIRKSTSHWYFVRFHNAFNIENLGKNTRLFTSTFNRWEISWNKKTSDPHRPRRNVRFIVHWCLV